MASETRRGCKTIVLEENNQLTYIELAAKYVRCSAVKFFEVQWKTAYTSFCLQRNGRYDPHFLTLYYFFFIGRNGRTLTLINEPLRRANQA